MPRQRTTAVVGSPTLATETVIAAIAPGAIPLGQGGDPVDLEGTVDITIGTGGTALTLRIERGTTSAGPLLATIGPLTVVAGNRVGAAIQATDLESNTGYVLTAQVTGASAGSTVNNVNFNGVW